MQYQPKFCSHILKRKKSAQEFIMILKILSVAKAILQNKYTAGSTIISNTKIFHNAIVIKTDW